MDFKDFLQLDEAGYGRNKGYAHGFASPNAPSLGSRRREDDEYHVPDKKPADHPHAVHINGKKWKSYGSQSHAQNVANKIKGATVHKEEVEIAEATTGATKLVHTRTGKDGAKYHIMQDSPTDYSIHREHNGKTKHIDTYGSLHRAKSVLDNEVKEEVELDESASELNNHISTFSKGVKSSAAKQSTYKRDNKPIHNMKHVETDASHKAVFDHLKKMGYKKTSGYDSKPNEFTIHHNRDEMTSKTDPVHHSSGVSAHVETEHGGKTKVHFTHRNMKEETMTQSFKGFLASLTELTDKQKKHIDQNKNGKIDSHDFKLLRKEDEHTEQAPVAPVPDKKYIKGTPENKALKASRKPINGMPTGKMKEEVELDELDKSTLKSYINKNIKSGRADDGGKGDTGLYRATNKVAGKLKTGTLDKKVKTLGNTSSNAHKNPYEYDASRSELKNRGIHNFAGRRTRTEEVEMHEAFINGREYASHGLMHPDHAKMDIHQKANRDVDFYASKTGNKMHGRVMKNDGKEVHIQADKELGDGKLHKFKVKPNLPKTTNEDHKKDDIPFDGPYKKVIGNGTVKDKSGAVHTPMSRARDLARKAMQKKMKEEFNIEITEEQAADLCDTASLDEKMTSTKMQTDGKKSYREFVELIAPQIQEGSPDEKVRDVAENAFDLKKSKTPASSGRYDIKQDGNRTIVTRKYNADTGHSTGTDDEEKPEGEKRGRGRPAGSTSGAKQKGSANKSDYRGIDYKTHSLHLPNSK